MNAILKQNVLFSGFSDEQIEEVARIAEHRHYRKGDMIFFDEDEASGFYVVIEGNIKIFKLSPEGKEKILHIFGPGAPFGEVPVFSGERFPANSQAINDSRVLFFPRDAFVALIRRTPSLALKMLAVLSMRLRQFAAQIENLSLKEVPARLASYIILLTEEQQNGHFVRLEISKGQLASLLGTIPETLSRIFSKMSDLEMIDVNGKQIRIADMEALKDLAEGGKL